MEKREPTVEELERPFDPSIEHEDDYAARIAASKRARREAQPAKALPPIEPSHVNLFGVWHDGRVGWRAMEIRVPFELARQHAVAEHEPDTMDVAAARFIDLLERESEAR